MMQNKDQKSVQEQHIQVKGQKADEAAALRIDEYVRIFDPNNKEIHLEKRA